MTLSFSTGFAKALFSIIFKKRMNESDAALWFAKVEKFWFEKRSDLKDGRDWFFGSENIPKWLGYCLGYKLVTRYRKSHPELSWEELIKIPSKDFIGTQLA